MLLRRDWKATGKLGSLSFPPEVSYLEDESKDCRVATQLNFLSYHLAHSKAETLVEKNETSGLKSCGKVWAEVEI